MILHRLEMGQSKMVLGEVLPEVGGTQAMDPILLRIMFKVFCKLINLQDQSARMTDSSSIRIASLEEELKIANERFQDEKRRSNKLQLQISILEVKIRSAIQILATLSANLEEKLMSTRISMSGDDRPEFVYEFGQQNVNETRTSMSSSRDSVDTVLLPERDDFCAVRSPDQAFSDDIETLRGVQSPPSNIHPPESEWRISSSDQEPFVETDLEDKTPHEHHEDIVPISFPDPDLEDETPHDHHEDIVPISFPDPEELRHKKRKLTSAEQRVVKELINRYSTENPKKWVDDCREELQILHDITIGSSSITTTKFRMM